MLVLNANLHPQDPQDPVFDLMCVPSVMQRKCKASKMAGAPVAIALACSGGRLYGAETLPL